MPGTNSTTTISGGSLACAAHDYRWLLDRGYPNQQALQLCGDRFRLSRTERGMLYRGVFSREASLTRSARLAPGSASGELTVDGHNVLFTVWNYLAGRPLVRATDGFVRDIGGTRGRLPHDQRFTRIAELLCTTVSRLGFRHVMVLLDAQLPWSRDQSGELAATWTRVSCAAASSEAAAIAFTAAVHQSVDGAVAARSESTIATSDTGIVDRCTQPVLDLGGHIVTNAFGATPVDMERLCASGAVPDPG